MLVASFNPGYQRGFKELKPIAFERLIRLENIEFRYGLDEPLVLDKINLSIAKGSRTGIIGITGSGKSTTLYACLSKLNTRDHKIITYTAAGCGAGADDHGLTSATTNSNSVIVDGLVDGTYWMTVTAYDAAGNSTVSSCSSAW